MSVSDWYRIQDFTQGSPVQTSINNFDALIDGRTRYVSAINDTQDPDDSSIWNNIYLISMSDNASENTINIYNQLVDNWRFLVNIQDTDEQEKLRRDLDRVEHAYSVAQAINNKSYPIKLESGSFKKGLSISTWPSWQGALSTDLGIPMPKDPIQSDPDKNAINCAEDLQPTCWDGSEFACAGDFEDDRKSTFYSYEYNEGENQSIFQLNLEYSTNDNWANILTGTGWTLPNGSACHNAQYTKQY